MQDGARAFAYASRLYGQAQRLGSTSGNDRLARAEQYRHEIARREADGYEATEEQRASGSGHGHGRQTLSHPYIGQKGIQMAVYTVVGHPLNPSDLPEAARPLVMYASVGATITVALSGADDTKVKGHGALK